MLAYLRLAASATPREEIARLSGISLMMYKVPKQTQFHFMHTYAALNEEVTLAQILL